MSSGKKDNSPKTLTRVSFDDIPFVPHPSANPNTAKGFVDKDGNFLIGYNIPPGGFPKGANVAVVGSRNYGNNGRTAMDNFFNSARPSSVTSGGAKGADRMGRETANNRGIGGKDYYPNWSKGRGAGMDRNTDIVNNSKATAAFYGKEGRTRGTADTVAKSINKGLPTLEAFER